MKTYNLFHLYIVTTILLLLVIELYHYIILLVSMNYISLVRTPTILSATDLNDQFVSLRTGTTQLGPSMHFTQNINIQWI